MVLKKDLVNDLKKSNKELDKHLAKLNFNKVFRYKMVFYL